MIHETKAMIGWALTTGKCATGLVQEIDIKQRTLHAHLVVDEIAALEGTQEQNAQ
jgi:hypothetical protein